MGLGDAAGGKLVLVCMNIKNKLLALYSVCDACGSILHMGEVSLQIFLSERPF